MRSNYCKKNPSLKNVEKIRGIIIRRKEVQIERNIAQNSMYFKHAPLTSVKVGRSSSKLKMILRAPSELLLKHKILKKQLIITCNHLTFN